MHKSVVALFALCLMLVNASSANCNRNEQSGDEQQTFELPDVPIEPFSFEDPDPARTLRSLEYSIDPEGKTVFLIGVSGRLKPDRAAAVHKEILRLLTDSMCHPADVAVIWDADTLTRIATLRIGDRVRNCDSKWIKFKVAENQAEIAGLNRHFHEMKQARHEDIADLYLPRLTTFLGQEFHEYPDYPNRILILFGSPLSVARDGQGVSLERSYPTVGTLRAALSPFSTRDKSRYLGNTVTHFVVNEEDFYNILHQAGLRNFWSAYFSSQGSPLLTFSPDPRVSERVMNSQLPPIPAYVDDINPGYVSIDTETVDLFDDLDDYQSLPSPLERGSLTLGLMWQDRGIDLDMHVGLDGEGERLSFRNPRTEFGMLRKNFGTGWEEVYFDAEMSPRDVEVWVNFYAGLAATAEVRGELRISYAGQLFRTPVIFEPAVREGNGGDPNSPGHWVEIDLSEVIRGRN